jgi:uncharacterized Rossmann fold enzyme
MNNLAENLPEIRAGLDLEDLPHKKGEPVIIIGAGPSLKHYGHLKMIADSGWKHPIICCDRVLGDALKHKLKPYVVATVDAAPQLLGFYSQPIVRNYANEINGAFNVFTHPKVVKEWESHGGKVYWFVPMIDNPRTADEKINARSQTYMMHLLTKQKGIISGIGNVGAFSWNLAYSLEADPICLVGLDFSEQVKDKSEAVYFNSFTSMFMQKTKDVNAAMDKAADLHQLEENPDFICEEDDPPYYNKGKHPTYLVNPIWKEYRNNLAWHIVSSGKHTINATMNGCLHTQAKNEKGDFILKCPNFQVCPLSEVLKTYA